MSMMVLVYWLIMVLNNCSADHQQSYNPIVQKLKNYVETHKEFAADLDKIYHEAGYSNMTYDIMYKFFNKWLTTAPNPQQLLNILPSMTLYQFTKTKAGNATIFKQHTVKWFYEWIETWKQYLDSYESTSVIPLYYNYPMFNLGEYIVPQNGFKSFNHFFTRQIKPELRPITSPNNNIIITSPVDAIINVIIPNIGSNDVFNVKGTNFNLVQILGNKEKAKMFANGAVITMALQVYNYHRYHSHCSGTIKNIDQIGGIYYYWPATCNNDQPLLSGMMNKRGIVYLENDLLGLTGYVAIGASEISSVNFGVKEGDIINKGDEIGYFAYGGSFFMLLFQPNVINHFSVTANQTIKMGQVIATANSIQLQINDVVNNENSVDVVAFIFELLVVWLMVGLVIVCGRKLLKYRWFKYQSIPDPM
eukprot:531073_1